MKYATQHGIFEKERRRTARSPLFSGLSGGALGEIRTPDPRIRSPMLSDADLALAYRGLSARARIGPKADFHQCRFWRSADERVARRTLLLRTKQRGTLQFPDRRQRLEQIIKLKRVGLASSEDRLNDVWRN